MPSFSLRTMLLAVIPLAILGLILSQGWGSVVALLVCLAMLVMGAIVHAVLFGVAHLLAGTVTSRVMPIVATPVLDPQAVTPQTIRNNQPLGLGEE
jgi:hypothetical protein